MTELPAVADQIPPSALSRLPRRRCVPVPLELVQAGDRDRAELEAFIQQVFARAYGARVSQFMPRLIGLRGTRGRLAAALGMRSGASGPLFLEQYLGGPVERLLEAHAGRVVSRAGIMELGNLAAEHPGSARRLILNLAVCLHRAGFAWVVFTITPSLVNSFRRLGLELICLGPARRERLAPQIQAEWGSYYDTGPLVYAAHIPGGLPRVRTLLHPGAPEPAGDCVQPQLGACDRGVLALAG